MKKKNMWEYEKKEEMSEKKRKIYKQININSLQNSKLSAKSL